MRWVILLVWVLTACGSDSDGGGSTAAPAPTVQTVTLLIGACTDTACKVAGAAVLSDEQYDKTAYGLFYVWSRKLFVPECTVQSAAEDLDGVFQIPDQPYDVFVSLRACIKNKATGEFDQGLTAETYTPVK